MAQTSLICSDSFVLGRFPFVRNDRPDHSRRKENCTFNQNYPSRSIKSYITCRKDVVFHQKLLGKAYFMVEMTGPAMIQPASSDFWKAPIEYGQVTWIKVEGAMPPGYYCFRSILCWSHHLLPLPTHKMLLESYEGDTKPISPRSTNHNISFGDFCRQGI